MATFKSAFKVIEKAAGDNADVYRKTFSVNILRKIARNTPVDTGRATGNWIIQGGTPNLTPMHRYDQSVTAGPTVDQAKRDVKKIPKKTTIYISNAVQCEDDDNQSTGEGYIIGLENGASLQAFPGMMFSKNIALSKVISDMTIKEIFR